MKHLRKVAAFVKRDFLIESSYKLAFVLDLLKSVFPVFTFYFVARLVDRGGSDQFAEYDGGYFAFVLVGIALTQYFLSALRVFATSVRRAQTTGVLEAILSTQTSPQEVILYTSAYSFLASTLHLVVVFSVAGLFLGVSYASAHLLSVALALVLTILTFSSLGILSATAILVLKKGDPIEILIGSTSSLLGGAFFPIELMPGWLQAVAQALPITYALQALRQAIFGGASPTELWYPLVVLAGISVVLLPSSLWLFSRAVDRGRREGSLIQY